VIQETVDALTPTRVFRTLGLMPSGPAALPWWSLSSCLLTWSVVTDKRGKGGRTLCAAHQGGEMGRCVVWMRQMSGCEPQPIKETGLPLPPKSYRLLKILDI